MNGPRQDTQKGTPRAPARPAERGQAEPTPGAAEPVRPQRRSPFREIARPFLGPAGAAKSACGAASAAGPLWALNFTYFIEGFAYLGTLTYLAMFFNEYVKLGDRQAGWMVGLMTAGITFSMLFFGSRVDAWGLRRTLFAALGLMSLGRAVLALSPHLGLACGGLLAPMNLVAALGILLVVLGFGMYQPAVYAGTRAVTTAATSGMAFAMLYALYNLGGWLPTFMSPIRKSFGISGALGFYALITLLGMAGLFALLSRKTLEKALKEKKGTEQAAAPLKEASAGQKSQAMQAAQGTIGANGQASGFARFLHWLKNHPLADPKFSFFIFCLIPVQSLFAYNWLIMPQYVARAYSGGWIGKNFETATSLNALLICRAGVEGQGLRHDDTRHSHNGPAALLPVRRAHRRGAVRLHSGPVRGRGHVAAQVPPVRRRNGPRRQDRRVHGRRAAPVVPDEDAGPPLLRPGPLQVVPPGGPRPDRHDVARLRPGGPGHPRPAAAGQRLGREGLQDEGGGSVRPSCVKSCSNASETSPWTLDYSNSPWH